MACCMILYKSYIWVYLLFFFMFPEKYLDKRNRLIELIKEKSLIVSGDTRFNLASGGKSNFFFDLKYVSLDPEGSNLIAEAILEIIRYEEADYIGGLESGAIPIVTSVCEKSWLIGRPIAGFFVRKEEKKKRDNEVI